MSTVENKYNKQLVWRKSAFLAFQFCFLFSLFVYGQENIPINSWRSHFSYQDGVALASNTNRLFVSSRNGFFSYRFEDESFQIIGQNEGIIPTGISALHFEESLGLLIGYEDGRIIQVKESGIRVIDVFFRTPHTGSKRIRGFFHWQGRLLVSGDYGYLWIDLDRNILRETYYQIGPNASRISISQIRLFEGQLYFATSIGLLQATASATTNFQNFNNYGQALGFSSQEISGLIIQDGRLVAASGSGRIANHLGEEIQLQSNILSLQNGPGEALLGTSEGIFFLESSNLEVRSGNNLLEVISAQFVNNQWWLLSPKEGLFRFNGNLNTGLMPKGPASGNLLDMSLGENNLLLSQSRENEGSLSLFQSGTWTVWENENLPYRLLKSQKKGEIWEGITDRGALIRLNEQGQIVSTYDSQSPGSSLLASDNLDFPLLSGLAKDSKGKSWLSQKQSNNLLHRVDEGNHAGFALGTFREPESLYINSLDDKWMPLSPGSGGGILVFNEELNFFRRLSTANADGGLPSNEVLDLKEDRQGRMWIATARGLCFLPDQFLALSEEILSVSFPTIDFIIQLTGERINSIDIDGGNRVWIASDRGLALWDERRQSLQRLTMENSPLPSNRVLKIRVAPQSGEVFIYTERGLVSFQSPALGREISLSKTKIYPNPVIENTETLTIDGLPENAHFKITDVSGRLVYEDRALGQRGSWTKGLSSARAGVYLVFATGENGREHFVGRFIKRIER